MKNNVEQLIKPILLFGMPRSGTSWLGKIFDSHPDVFYRHEPDSWQRVNWMPLVLSKDASEKFEDQIEQYAIDTLSFSAPKVASKLPIFKKSYYSGFRYYLIHLGIYLSKFGERIGIKLPVVGQPDGRSLRKIRRVWKSIEALGRLSVIQSALYDAKAVHIVRHPCGYIASVLRGEARKNFDDKRPSSEDYGILEVLLESGPAQQRGLTLDDMRACTPVQRLAWRWVLYNENAYAELNETSDYKVLFYDDFCKDPMSGAKEFFNFVELGWSAQTEAFLKRSTSNENSAYYSVYKDPLIAANKWKESLSKEDIEQVMSVVKSSDFATQVLGL